VDQHRTGTGPEELFCMASIVPKDAPDVPGVKVPPSTVFHRVTQKGRQLQLSDLRNDLIRQEETIIFGLIERSQFALNSKIYNKGAFPFLEQSGGLSFMEFFLLETEKLHAMCSRYQSPDENAFFQSLLPTPLLVPKQYPQILQANTVNVNSRIMSLYLDKVLPQICNGGVQADDDQYGSSAVNDINVLQAISKRVHFGKFVAEAKFQAETEKYTKLIMARDTDGLMQALTNRVVEERLLRRIHHKAQMYGSEIEDEGRCEDGELKINPEVIVGVYRDFLIPVTKDVEVDYLLRRCGPVPATIVQGFSGCQTAASEFWQLDSEGSNVGPVSRSATITHAFEEVRGGHVAWACVPLETSEAGMVRPTILEFCKELQSSQEASKGGQTSSEMSNSVQVIGEIYKPASFCVVSQGDSALREVAAETSVLRLCAEKLTSDYPTLVRTPVNSHAEALEHMKKHAHVCAIVPDDEITPSACSGQMRQEQIQGSGTNHFIIAGRGPCPAPSGRDHTLVLFSLQEAAGALVQALKAFETHGVNLSSIHSFLMPSSQSTYMFLVQADGHNSETPVKDAIAFLKECGAVSCCHVLGSYPAAPMPDHMAKR